MDTDEVRAVCAFSQPWAAERRTAAILPPADPDDDPRILQLQCTFRYGLAGLEAIEAGNRWCATPDELPDFREYVLGSAVLTAAAERSPSSVAIEIDHAE